MNPTEHIHVGVRTIQLINIINVCIHFTRVRVKYSIIIINYYVQHIACGI